MERKYTNGQIARAGERLAQYDIKDPQIENDIKIINDWRDAHLFGMNELSRIINKRSKQVGGNNILVSRLKKLESIKLKLQLNPNSNLCRMQDIGGCRIVVENINRLKAIVSRMSQFHGGFNLIKIDDYLNSPKRSGYRCVHLVFELIDDDKDNYKILLELQCRTLIQHWWATAVETVGLFNKISLKSNQGDEYWKNFFKYVSMLFEYDETKKIKLANFNIKELVNTILLHDRKYKCLSKIVSYKLARDFITNKNLGKEYYLLILDFAQHKILVKSYTKEDSESAQKDYAKLESENNPNINAVLVSAESVEEVNAGYPNYFADTENFLKKYRELTNKYR